MSKVSVIIPIFNVERYIECCARSLFEQTLQDMEFIFIDDCSSDNSIFILKDIAKHYPDRKEQIRIKKLERNSGPSVARNVGINIATGEYIAFCDSDDWVNPKMYELLYEESKKKDADICYCDFSMVYPDMIKNIFSISLNKDRVSFLQNYIKNGLTVLWNMIVHRRLYEIYQLKFPEKITYCEDFWLSVRLMYFADKIAKVDAFLYYYNRKNQISLLSNPSERAKIDELQSVLDTIKFLEEQGCINLYHRELSWRVLKSKQDMVLNPKEYHEFLQIYPTSHRYILSCPDSFCNKKIKILMWMLVHKMGWFVSGINYIRNLYHKVRFIVI